MADMYMCPTCHRMDGGHDEQMHNLTDPQDQGTNAGPKDPSVTGKGDQK